MMMEFYDEWENMGGYDYTAPPEDGDEDEDSLLAQMRRMEWQESQQRLNGETVTVGGGEDEPPSPVAKSPRKRANFFSKLADQIVEDGMLLFSEDGQAFAYDENVGSYQPIPQLTAWLANAFPSETTRSLLANDLREIAQRLAWCEEIRCSRYDFNRSRELVNLQNGVFNLETDELLEHDPRFRFTYQVKACYLDDPDRISCPVFEEFCRSSLDNDPDKRQLLLEMIGYICSDQIAGKCAFFLQGQPNSGKSVISEFVGRLFDPSLVSNVPLHQLGERFFRAELAGKKVNIAGEIAGRALRDISIFKSITGGDRITGEFKGKDPFYFTPSCKLLFAGNTLPRTTEADTTAAFVNRLKVLLFQQSIPPEKQDKQLLNRIWREADSIVTLALHAVQGLMERNFEFTLPADSRVFLRSFVTRSNILSGFLEECCILSPESRVFNTDLFGAFTAYCARNGLDAPSRPVFYDLLSGVPHVYAKRIRIGSDNRQGHIGIGLKEQYRVASGQRPQFPGTQGDEGSGTSGTHIISGEGGLL